MSERDVNPAAKRSEEAGEGTGEGTGEGARERAAAAAPVVRDEHEEAQVTRLIEQQAARVPSHWFLMASIAALGASLALELTGRTRWSQLVGMWAPTLLITGVYNKLVKGLGSR